MPSSKPVFPLRLPPDQRARAERRAADLGVSLNALIAIALDQYLTPQGAPKASSARVAADVSRNGPCPCGSGKKYKRCCGG